MIPITARHVLDTFHHTTCRLTGWASTICGTYSDIADQVNTRHGTAYTIQEIGWAMTWLHEHGPDRCGAFISKVGPGNRKTEVVFEDAARAPITVDGNVYMLVLDGVPLPADQMRVLALGLIEWCSYRFNSLRNDIVDLSMTRGALPASIPTNRSIRRALNEAIARNRDEMVNVQALQTQLSVLV